MKVKKFRTEVRPTTVIILKFLYEGVSTAHNGINVTNVSIVIAYVVLVL
jgi:hypothetical protein